MYKHSSKMVIKALVLDFDDTLVETSKQLDPEGKKALLMYLQTTLRKTKEEAEQIYATLSQTYLSLHGIAGALEKEYGCNHAYQSILDLIDVSPLTLPDDTKRFLEHTKHYKRYIITTGLHDFQHKKIAQVGITDHFEIFIDAFTPEGKKHFLQQILQTYTPGEILCIGDNIRSEIAAANSLGMYTVRVLRGKRSVFTPRNSLEQANYTVQHLIDILPILEQLNTH